MGETVAFLIIFVPVVQWIEFWTPTPTVVGSTPIGYATKTKATNK